MRGLHCGKESQLPKSSTTSHLISFSTATTFLEGFSLSSVTGLCTEHHLTVVFSQLQASFLHPLVASGFTLRGQTLNLSHIPVWTTESSWKVVLIRADWQNKVLFNLSTDLLDTRCCWGCSGVVSLVWSKAWKMCFALLLTGLLDRIRWFSSSAPYLPCVICHLKSCW